jgi:hypothetical protein
VTIYVFWAIVIIAGSVGFGILLEWLIAAIRHRNEHYERNSGGAR